MLLSDLYECMQATHQKHKNVIFRVFSVKHKRSDIAGYLFYTFLYTSFDLLLKQVFSLITSF